MKYLIVIIITIILTGCNLLSICKQDWKEKYGIKPGTGIFAGKFELLDEWKNKRIMLVLTDTTGNYVSAFDTIGVNGTILLNNLPSGKYCIDAFDTLRFFPDHKLGHVMAGSAISREECKLKKIICLVILKVSYIFVD